MSPTEAQLASRYTLATAEVEVLGARYQLVHPRSIDELLEEKDLEVHGRLPYWAEIWPSARMLAEYLSKYAAKHPVRGARLIEFGCGSGLATLAAAAAGFDVLSTDYCPEALEFTVVNAARNQLPGVATRLLDWRDMPDDLGQFDFVIAADVLYEKANAALVAAAFKDTLAPGGLGLLTDPGRTVAKPFAEEASDRGLTVRSVERRLFIDGDSKPTVELFELRWPG